MPTYDEILAEETREEKEEKERQNRIAAKNKPYSPPMSHEKGTDTRIAIAEDEIPGFIKKLRENDIQTPTDGLNAYIYAKKKYGHLYHLPQDPPQYLIDERRETTPSYIKDRQHLQNQKYKDNNHGWFMDAVRRGGNESITGLAYHIAKGNHFWE